MVTPSTSAVSNPRADVPYHMVSCHPGLFREILLAMHRPDQTAFDDDRLIGEPVPFPDRTRGDDGRYAQRPQRGDALFVKRHAGVGDARIEMAARCDPVAERQLVGDEDVRLGSGHALGNLVPLRAMGQQAVRPFDETDAHPSIPMIAMMSAAPVYPTGRRWSPYTQVGAASPVRRW